MALLPGATALLPVLPPAWTPWLCGGALLLCVGALGLKQLTRAAANFEACPHCEKPIVRGKSICYLCLRPLNAPAGKTHAVPGPARPRKRAIRRTKGGA
ncbi:hypothetical protein D3C86_1032600 [compost metagenome]